MPLFPLYQTGKANPPPACEVMTPEQKAAFLPAAALLPADTDSFMVLSNVGRVLKRFDLDSSAELAAISGIESVAVGISDEAVALLQALVNQMGQGPKLKAKSYKTTCPADASCKRVTHISTLPSANLDLPTTLPWVC